jgi:hypothetical protein
VFEKKMILIGNDGELDVAWPGDDSYEQFRAGLRQKQTHNEKVKSEYTLGKCLYIPNEQRVLEYICVKTFLRVNASAQIATLSFIWCMQQQNMLPNELIEKIAKKIWESRQQEPALWLHV